MLPPNVGQLLRGTRQALADSVSPKLDDPGAQRQLKAALHLLGRLSRCWDLPHSLLQSDNEDIETVIAAIRARMTAAGQPLAEEAAIAFAPRVGINDRELARLTDRNLKLCAEIEALERQIRDKLPRSLATGCLGDLHALFERMTMRESILVGDIPPADPATARVSATE